MPLRLAPLALISLLALAGCGATSSQSVTGTPTLKEALVAPTATITKNYVTLTSDRLTYRPGDPVRVTIANGQGVGVSAIASQANCTVLGIQMQSPSGWQAHNGAPCDSQADQDTLEITARSAVTVTITAPAAGMYRCALRYVTITVPPPRSAPKNVAVSATNPTSGPAITVYSTAWEVRRA